MFKIKRIMLILKFINKGLLSRKETHYALEVSFYSSQYEGAGLSYYKINI